MRSHTSSAALLVGEALLAGCALTTFASCDEPRATTAAYGMEIAATPSTHAPGSVPARDFIGEVRLGHGLDTLGKVPPSFGASEFLMGSPIHLSLWEVTEAPAGSVVRVSVRDATNRIVWSEEKKAPHGGSYQSFGIGRKLASGSYRAEVEVGHEVRTRTSFEIYSRESR